MELMAERWTEDRLDDLKQEVEKQGRRMDDGFRDVRSEFASVRQEIGDVRGEVAGVRSDIGVLRKEMDERFDRIGERLEARFDIMLYALLGFGGAMFAAMASLVAAVIVSL
jgi:predicted  nucleic acid-binding Zn-ribbon protein